jgi:hypothetical protein
MGVKKRKRTELAYVARGNKANLKVCSTKQEGKDEGH